MGIIERKKRQKQALRERILDAARRIVVHEGFAALSMRKIAEAIEYSPATLYLHFASRDEIARALCAEGYAQLLATFVPLVGIADPAERLKALGRAYVAFGVAHPQTYRLIFMEDPSYTGAALGGAAGVSDAGQAGALTDQDAASAATDSVVDTTASATAAISADPAANFATVAPAEDPGAAAMHIMLAALEELRAAGRLPASMDATVWAEALWATLHGIVALNLTCPVFPTAPLDTLVGVALDAWLGVPEATPQQANRRTAPPRNVASAAGARKKKSAADRAAQASQLESPDEPENHPPTRPPHARSAEALPKKPLSAGAKRRSTTT
ncbi:TetR/AcrR family transcriptional regulator [Paraburkholderia sediminicola]|uniref:TetR/AcrR family transcriptional regulator n=1 Tax=Paraburkholderia rhynchosiae TaxID=487049 RepID=A0ACC7NH34_9BURK